jgi:hypothetical protein
MLKLKAIYDLPTKKTALSDFILTERWIPEVPDLGYHVDHATWVAMDEEGLLVVKQVAYGDNGADRYAAIFSLWFKDKPVGIFQEAGRGGRDHFKRWITDADAFVALCQYLRTKLCNGEDQLDIYDPEHEVYPEEMFGFYGQDFGTALGYPPEPAAKGFHIIFDGAKVIQGANPAYALVTALPKYDPMPEYIRRREYVYKKVAPLTATELASNPRIEAVCKEDGHTHIYWYQMVIRPSDQPILAI